MNVMVCSEDATLCYHLEQIIKELGYKPMLFKGADVVSAISTHRPEIVLLNLPMDKAKNVQQALFDGNNLVNKHYNPAFVVMGRQESVDRQLFELGQVYYLGLPADKDKITKLLTQITTLNDAQIWQLNNATPPKNQRRQFISARTHRGLELVYLKDIYYFAADQKYIKIRHKDGMVLIDETLKNLEKEFGGVMCRIHRNALINLAYLDRLEAVDSGQYKVCFRNIDDTLLVSRRHLPALREKIHKI